MQFLNSSSRGTQKESVSPVAVEPNVELKSEPVPAASTPVVAADSETDEEKQERKTRIKTERSEKPAVQKDRVTLKPKEWGDQPHFSTPEFHRKCQTFSTTWFTA